MTPSRTMGVADAPRERAQFIRPGQAQLRTLSAIDLCQRAKALLRIRAAVSQPVVWFLVRGGNAIVSRALNDVDSASLGRASVRVRVERASNQRAKSVTWSGLH